MVIQNLEKYEILKDELRNLKQNNSNINTIILEMKKCINFNEQNEKQKLDKKVEKIIKVFSDKFEEETGGIACETFTEGFCYYFAVVLKKMVEELLNEKALIYTTHTNGAHAIVKVGNNFYDINGNINNRYDRLGYLKNDIDQSEYLISEPEDFLYFVDLCNFGKKKEVIIKEEKITDKIKDDVIKKLKYEKIF